MWVEKVYLKSYGAVQSESVIFSQDKVNLVVEPNEYGKTTMATAIWSILFDFGPEVCDIEEDRLSARDARRPKPGLGYQASLDISTDNRRLTISRDFAAGTFNVYDRDRKNADVTGEFVGKNGEDEVLSLIHI